MRLGLIVLTVLMLSFAGCLGAARPSDPVRPAAAPSGGDTSAPAAASNAPVGNATTSALRVVPIAFDGVTPAYAEPCAFAIVGGTCGDLPPTADFSKVRVEPKLNGTPKSLRVTITWTAASPAESQMTIFAGSHSGNQYGSGWGATGPSPLSLNVPDLALKPGYQLYVGLAGPWAGEYTPAGGASASANPMDQPWKLAGEVTLT